MKHTWMLLNVVYYLFSISFIQNELQLRTTESDSLERGK